VLIDPRINNQNPGNTTMVLDKYDPALAVQQGFRPIESVRTRSIFWCLVAGLSVCVIMLLIDIA
jgi:hypothetical protein